MAEPIDVIISYVNGSDSNWVKDYINTTRTHNPSSIRYRSWGTLKYLFRGISKYMPFVRNVILVVSRHSQVPVWVDHKAVRIVYHKDFIPEKFLPTFNSCTIESYFWNIKGLADKVIYFNDDMFPVGDMSEDDFFTGDQPHLHFTEPTKFSHTNTFRNQCRSSMDLITKALQLPEFEAGKIIRPVHISTPITKECLLKVKELCSESIEKTISTVRLAKNVNQYIYAYYQYFTDNYIDATLNYKYCEITEDTVKDIVKDILSEDYQIMCLNDSDKIRNYPQVRYQLTTGFDRKFPAKCKYEQ